MASRFRRWAMILLPVVVIARAVLLVFQFGAEHKGRAHAQDHPAWPPEAGEVLRFRTDDPHLAAEEGRQPLMAVLLEKDDLPQPEDTACLLDPVAMARRGGNLTLRGRTAAGTWRADWSGHRTTRTRDEVEEPEPDPQLRAVEAAILDGADCGETARVELTESQVGTLVDLLSGRAPPADLPPSRAGLSIRAVLPQPP